MASERFLNLESEKRERILEAARKEFARKTYEEVSINQIIKEAGISRGSFYTYFEDKEDILHYIMESQEDVGMKYLRIFISESCGDFWEGLRKWIKWVIVTHNDNRTREGVAIMMNLGVFRSLQNNIETNFGDPESTETEDIGNTHNNENAGNACIAGIGSYHSKGEEAVDWIMKNVRPECFGFRTDREEILVLFTVAMGISAMHILFGLSHPKHLEGILRRFDIAMDYLKDGVSGVKQAIQ